MTEKRRTSVGQFRLNIAAETLAIQTARGDTLPVQITDFSQSLQEDINLWIDECRKVVALLNSDRVKTYSDAAYALFDHLAAALADPRIQASPQILSIAVLLQDIVRKADVSQSGDDLIQQIEAEGARQAISEKARHAASSKNASAKSLAIELWPTFKAKGWSKAKFSRQCVEQKVKFLQVDKSVVIPSADRIARYWLKGL